MSRAPVRIANSSGFYGDRHAAVREMVEGGPIDFLTGDYLAELTMVILWRNMQRPEGVGYARSFLRQIEEVLGTCIDRGIKVVTNAGGLQPAKLAADLRALADRLGLRVSVAHVEGDDLLGRLADLQRDGTSLAHMDTGAALDLGAAAPISANAYLGGWGIVQALAGGAEIVVCGRVTDASLAVGPAAWWHGWNRDDWDRLAGAVVAGHVIECGAQATGGNYAFFREVPGLVHPGFPIAEIEYDGSSVITKHPGTGGLVSPGTVTAQLLYEIGGERYVNPDVVARFDTIELSEEGPDRVRISGVRGEPAPQMAKAALNILGGWRNSVTFVLTGLEIAAKAALAGDTMFAAVGGPESFDHVSVRLIRTDKPDAPTNAEASAELQITVKDRDPAKVGRSFTNAAVEMALASYPGLHLTAPPGDGSPFAICWPALVPASEISQRVVFEDGKVVLVEPVGRFEGDELPLPDPSPPLDLGPTRRAPLGEAFGARSGDKAGSANVGIWGRNALAYSWLAGWLTADRFRELVPETVALTIRRYEFPKLLALNFVIEGLLEEGVAASTRPDPQAKSLGEYVRSRVVDLPVAIE